jgi:hypothetical protein
VRCAGGEFEAVEGAISTYDGLSWGAGDGAIAMAVLMMLEAGGSEDVRVARLGYTSATGRVTSCALLNSSILERIRASCVFLLPA